MDEVIMQLIMNAGDAKSDCMLAMQVARKGDFQEAHDLLEKSNSKILKIHKLQHRMMQKECNGERVELSILLIHAQDHLTNAIVTYDLVTEFIAYMEENEKRLQQIEG